MLSYQHSFHAGNHADVLKHLTLTLILLSLKKKEKPFTLFDTHGGAGIYQLDDSRLQHTGEAEKGIIKLIESTKSQDNFPQTLKPYLELCELYSKHGLYPGSPEIERCLMRKIDKLFVAELHPTEIQVLKGNMESLPLLNIDNKPKVTVLHTNGFDMLKSYLPPIIRRGMIIIDPSYETDSDYTEVPKTVTKVLEKWNTAIIAIWYPLLKHRTKEIIMLKNKLLSTAQGKNLTNFRPPVIAELQIYSETQIDEEKIPRLYGSGMIIINPPYQLDNKLAESLPYLAKVLGKNQESFFIRGEHF